MTIVIKPKTVLLFMLVWVVVPCVVVLLMKKKETITESGKAELYLEMTPEEIEQIKYLQELREESRKIGSEMEARHWGFIEGDPTRTTAKSR